MCGFFLTPPQALSTLPSWPVLAGLAVLTFFVANGVAACLQRRRQARIVAKLEEVSKPRAAGLSRTPVTVVTGFLGSGKTTLVNHMLANPGGRRIAVIENEVGSVSIDHTLLREGEDGNPRDGVYVLKNGCMCCSGDGSGEELERVLDQLLKMVTSEFDCVVVELSGLADPAPVVRAFFRPEMETSRFYLDGVVTVVDAKHIGYHLGGTGFTARTREAHTQIAYADRLLLNKVDLVGGQELAATEDLVRSVNAAAGVTHCRQSAVDLDAILGLQAYDLQRASVAQAPPGAGHTHTSDIGSVTVSASHPLSLVAVEAWLRDTVQTSWQDLFRVKGILDVLGTSKRYVVQGVHAELLGGFQGEWVPTDDGSSCDDTDCGVEHSHGLRVSQLVFIGRNLDAVSLQAGLDACVAGEDLTATEPRGGVRRRVRK